jgi:hypothetical protein
MKPTEMRPAAPTITKNARYENSESIGPIDSII